MKMAKASELDLSNAMEICHSLESMTHNFYPSVPSGCAKLAEGEESEELDWTTEQCQRILRHLMRHERGLARVVYGCSVMLDPSNKLVDPNADTIERYPAEPPMAKPLVWDVDGVAWLYSVTKVWKINPGSKFAAEFMEEKIGLFDSEAEAKAACESHHQTRFLEQMA